MRYELHYWPGIQGRGEYVRLALEEGGVHYVEVDASRGPRPRRRGSPADCGVHQLQLTLADWVSEAHDVHHPIASSLYYEEQKREAGRRAAHFIRKRIPKYLAYSTP